MRPWLSWLLVFATGGALADQVTLNSAGSQDPVVLIDAAYPEGCANDRPFQHQPTQTAAPIVIDVGDAGPAGGCRSEVVAFSDGNALRVLEQPDFSAPTADIVVNLEPRLSVPVYTWVLRAAQPSSVDEAKDRSAYAADVVSADEIFDRSHAGIEFVDQGIEFHVDPPWVPTVVALADEVYRGMAVAQDLIDELSTRIQPKPEGVNVYRLELDEIGGFHIRKQDGTSTGTIVIGNAASGSTLAHELGHAMSLDHVSFEGKEVVYQRSGTYCAAYGQPDFYDGVCDYRKSNLMWPGMPGDRDHITEGQAFRAAVNARSFLNTHQPPLRGPNEPRRDCADWIHDGECPYVALEVDQP